MRGDSKVRYRMYIIICTVQLCTVIFVFDSSVPFLEATCILQSGCLFLHLCNFFVCPFLSRFLCSSASLCSSSSHSPPFSPFFPSQTELFGQHHPCRSASPLRRYVQLFFTAPERIFFFILYDNLETIVP